MDDDLPFDAVLMPPTIQARYPHMFKHDVAIWERFIVHHGGDYQGFLYDVKVGSGTEPPEALQEPYVSMQSTLSKWRIDVVGLKPDRLDIIEVKPSAGISAIGQVLSYRNLFVKQHQPLLKVTASIVTDFERPDMRKLCMEHGIKYYIL